ncbi:rap ran-gap family protein [Lichtheimia corymbifera JMRC:FSU:9682]|uniref:Rap ran-gap family protein n=1 Tax=Lichtheimia corymbifera JMRC:FSU:9682 TaxID=1263082 RepID=A0A068RNJ9_9FUNG|nr:rap ran-gap family protein [Lichtheimia corymbifera JMRC:FSU:9682]
MAAPPPTVEECCDWVYEHCATFDDPDNDDGNVQVALDSVAILVNALDAPASVVSRLKDRIKSLKQSVSSSPDQVKKVVKHIQEICDECKSHIAATPSYIQSHRDEFHIEQPKILPNRAVADYASMWPDQLDNRAYWFRQYFVGKPYITLVGMDQDIIISIVRERTSNGGYNHRVVYREKKATLYSIVSENVARETETELEVHGQGHLLDHATLITDPKGRRRPLRSISSAIISTQQQHPASPSTRTMRAAVKAVHSTLDMRDFREMSAQATILSGLEKDLLRFDENEIPRCYKFGVLSVHDGQTTEEEWFGNSQLSESLERFLHIMGKPVELCGYKGYSAGLDTKSGESGEMSFASSWRDCEIMFHVAPLMPLRENDKQQVHRKRYIGNDIVCIVFVEGKTAKFDPDVIRSQFLHVYIVIHPEGKNAWRVQVATKKNVMDFTPMLSSPSIIRDEDELRAFLLLKMINAENAALKSDSFTLPNLRAREGALKAHSTMAHQFSETRPRFEEEVKRTERPKSAGAQRISRGSMRSLRSALVDNRPITPDLPPPPVPVSSRSSMLRDWKNLTRRRSSGGPTLAGGNHNNSSSGTASPSSSRGPSPLLMHSQQQRPILLEDTKATSLSSPAEDSDSSVHIVEQARHKNIPRTTTGDEGNNNNNTSIKSKAHHLVNSVIGRRNVPPIIRSKTFMMDHSAKLIQQGTHDRHDK